MKIELVLFRFGYVSTYLTSRTSTELGNEIVQLLRHQFWRIRECNLGELRRHDEWIAQCSECNVRSWDAFSVGQVPPTIAEQCFDSIKYRTDCHYSLLTTLCWAIESQAHQQGYAREQYFEPATLPLVRVLLGPRLFDCLAADFVFEEVMIHDAARVRTELIVKILLELSNLFVGVQPLVTLFAQVPQNGSDSTR